MLDTYYIMGVMTDKSDLLTFRNILPKTDTR